jgi:hypothetical protein
MSGLVVNVRIQDRWLLSAVVKNGTEPDPEHIYRACNRIENLPDDIRSLAQEMPFEHLECLIELRAQLDRHHAPSMSVGDRIETANHTLTVDRYGWVSQPRSARLG